MDHSNNAWSILVLIHWQNVYKISLGSCSAARKERRSDKRSAMPCHSLKTEHWWTWLAVCPPASPGRGLARGISLCQRCLVHHSPPWLVLLNFPDHQRRAQQLNLCAAHQTLAAARFPFSSTEELMCIHLQAAGNPSLMTRHHSTDPFSVGGEKSLGLLNAVVELASGHRCHLLNP